METPSIQGVEHRRLEARGVDFHVAEAGDGETIVCLHGWPQNFYEWRDLLADPPMGRRIVAPDLPGFGWSGAAPHRMSIDDITSDLQVLFDELELERVLLVGHDWGGWLGYELVLREPERYRGFLAMNIPHFWNGPRDAFPHALPMLGYQPPVVAFGVPLHRYTGFVRWALRAGTAEGGGFSEDELEVFAAPFRTKVGARAARDIYRSLWRELPALVREPELRRLEVPTQILFGTEDKGIRPSLSDPARVPADDLRVRWVTGVGHFIVDERPRLVREYLLALDQRTS